MGMPLQQSPLKVMNWRMALIMVHFSFVFIPGLILGVSFGLPP